MRWGWFETVLGFRVGRVPFKAKHREIPLPLVVMAKAMALLCEPEDLVKTAGRLGWEVALQRLQSVATVLRSHHQYEALGLEIDEASCHLLAHSMALLRFF